MVYMPFGSKAGVWTDLGANAAGQVVICDDGAVFATVAAAGTTPAVLSTLPRVAVRSGDTLGTKYAGALNVFVIGNGAGVVVPIEPDLSTILGASLLMDFDAWNPACISAITGDDQYGYGKFSTLTDAKNGVKLSYSDPARYFAYNTGSGDRPYPTFMTSNISHVAPDITALAMATTANYEVWTVMPQVATIGATVTLNGAGGDRASGTSVAATGAQGAFVTYGGAGTLRTNATGSGPAVTRVVMGPTASKVYVNGALKGSNAGHGAFADTAWANVQVSETISCAPGASRIFVTQALTDDVAAQVLVRLLQEGRFMQLGPLGS